MLKQTIQKNLAFIREFQTVHFGQTGKKNVKRDLMNEKSKNPSTCADLLHEEGHNVQDIS